MFYVLLPMLFDADPLINITINVPMGLGLVFGTAFVVYAIKSLM